MQDVATIGSLCCVPWSVYLHAVSVDSKNYKHNYTHLNDITTLKEWAVSTNMFDPAVLLRSDQVTVTHFGRSIGTVSLFRYPILPEWEHKQNINGVVLTQRFDRDKGNIWQTVLLDCVANTMHPCVNGIQMSCRCIRRVYVWKLDIWCKSAEHAENVNAHLTQLLGTEFLLQRRCKED